MIEKMLAAVVPKTRGHSRNVVPTTAASPATSRFSLSSNGEGAARDTTHPEGEHQGTQIAQEAIRERASPEIEADEVTWQFDSFEATRCSIFAVAAIAEHSRQRAHRAVEQI